MFGVSGFNIKGMDGPMVDERESISRQVELRA
jgi:hypothetical protein